MKRQRCYSLTVFLLFVGCALDALPQISTSQTSKAELFAEEVLNASDGDLQKLIDANAANLNVEFFQALQASPLARKNSHHTIKAFRYGLDQVRRGKDSTLIAQAHLSFGGFLLGNREFDTAKQTFTEMGVVLKSVDDPLAKGGALAKVGNLYFRIGQYGSAAPWYTEATKALEGLPTKDAKNWLGESWRGIAVYHTEETGDFTAALSAIGKAQELFIQTDNVVGRSSVLNTYGVIFDLLNNRTRSEQSYLDAIALLNSADPKRFEPRVASIKVNLGLLQTIGLGEFTKALKNFDEAEPILREDKFTLARIQGNRSIALRRLGKFDLGLEAAKHSLTLFVEEFKDEPNYFVPNAYSGLANAHLDLRQYLDAIVNAEKAVNLASSIREIKWIALTTKGRALSGLKRFAEARVAFEEAILIVEDLTNEAIGDEAARASYFGGFIYPYHYLSEMLLEQGDFQTALLYAERSKAKGILASLQGPRNNFSQGIASNEKREELALVKKLTSINNEISKNERPAEQPRLVRQREDLRRELETFHLRLYQSVPQLISRRADVLDGTKLDLLLPAKTVGLHYIVNSEKVSLLILTKDVNGKLKVSGHPLSITGSELKRRVRKFRSFLENDALGGFDEDARFLYDKLVKPAEPYLTGKETVAIVPEDILWDLPFQALLNGNRQFFIQDHPVFYTPSFFALSQTRKVKDAGFKVYKRQLLALGNPDLGTASKNTEIAKKMGIDLRPLPQAEDLVNDLCRKFSTCGDSAFVRKDATEKNLKEKVSGSRIVHLAAHGILDNSSPLYSHVVLSQSGNLDQEDGLLETWELMNLDLRSTEMLVLSACETARGDIRYGEGILGLSWAAFIAGSPTTVASQWKVDADSTKLLMNSFYDKLFPSGRGKVSMRGAVAVSKARAMQQAMISLKNGGRYSHPSFWAGFVVIGDGN